MRATEPPPSQIRGFNHLALVCRDMARTVEFYRDVLGFPLVKTVELPADMGQHFFFDIGGDNSLAFFWFPDAPEPAPGVSAPAARPDTGELTSAIGSMNHVSFTVDHDDFEAWRDRLQAHGVACSKPTYHDDSEWTVTDERHPGVYVRSMYFQDPDGILLELACWMRPLGPEDVRHEPASTRTREVL
jgi:catechol 2,3-dioxygenase-like lactoylglutathione lyase family enzyme